MGRSTNHATILVVGPTGAGKSSVVNKLLKAENRALTGEGASVSSDIVKYRIKVRSPDSSQSSKLTIIDTPGFGDTRNSELDRKLEHTLRSYLESSEPPTAVLIVLPFTENRYDGAESSFTKMLKSLKSLKKQVSDGKFTNLVLVLTHFIGGTRPEVNRPKDKIDRLTSVIRRFITVPSRFPVVLAENGDYGLRARGGSVKLPTGDYYPRNLISAIEGLLPNRRMKAIMKAAYADLTSPFPDIRESIVPFVESGEEVGGSVVIANPVEVQLARCWAGLSGTELGRSHPRALTTLQAVLQRNNIRSLDSLPNTNEEILLFMATIPTASANPALLQLIEEGLALKVPTLNTQPLAGQSFNVFSLSTMPHSIFKKSDELKLCPLGFTIPAHLHCHVGEETKEICKSFSSQEDYFNSKLSLLGLNAVLQVPALAQLKVDVGAKVSAGYTLYREESGRLAGNRVSYLREHRLFRLSLADDSQLRLKKSLVTAVKDLPEFDRYEDEVRDEYKSFFERYGTHVVTSCFGGGAIELKGSSSSSRKFKSMRRVEKHFGELKLRFKSMIEVGGGAESYEESESSSDRSLSGVAISTCVSGGNSKHHTLDLSCRSGAKKLEKWRKSLPANPIMLSSKLSLLPVSHFVAVGGMKDAAKNIDQAVKYLFEDMYELPSPESSSPESSPPPYRRSRTPPPPYSPPAHRPHTLSPPRGPIDIIIDILRPRLRLN